MNKEKLLNLLIDLKNHHSVSGVKIEFETEETNLDELLILKEIVSQASLNLTVKIGGCGALKDVSDAKKLNANTILAPMIESKYALRKFIETVKSIYCEEEIEKLQLLINIETIDGYNNLYKIIQDENFNCVDGIVLGRNDLISSMGKEKNFVNSNEILNIANTIAKEMENQNKILIIGGCIDSNSIEFFKQINSPTFTNFETRKIIFKLTNSIDKNSIYKAIEFEKLWLENKDTISNLDKKRIKHLEEIFVK